MLHKVEGGGGPHMNEVLLGLGLVTGILTGYTLVRILTNSTIFFSLLMFLISMALAIIYFQQVGVLEATLPQLNKTKLYILVGEAFKPNLESIEALSFDALLIGILLGIVWATTHS